MMSSFDAPAIDPNILRRRMARQQQMLQIKTFLLKTVTRVANVVLLIWLVLALRNTILKPEIFDNGMLNLGTTWAIVFAAIGEIVAFVITLPLLIPAAVMGNTGIRDSMAAFLREHVFNSALGSDNLPEDVNISFADNPSPFDVIGTIFENWDSFDDYMHQSYLYIAFYLLILTGITFVWRADMKQAAYGFILVQFMIFYGNAKGYIRDDFDMYIDVDSIGELLGSPLFFFGLMSYLYLEFGLQTSFLTELISPTATRQARVTKSLERLHRFRLGVVSQEEETAKAAEEKVDAAAEKQKKKKEEEDKKKKKGVSSASQTGSTLSKKYGYDALVLFLESASDSLFHKAGSQKDKLTSRLQRFHDGMLVADRNLDGKLTGTAATMNPWKTIAVMLITTAIRMAAMISLAYLCLNPATLLTMINLPESVTNSLEMDEPEGIVLVVAPVVVLILGASALIGAIQKQAIKTMNSILGTEDEEEEAFLETTDKGELIKEEEFLASLDPTASEPEIEAS